MPSRETGAEHPSVVHGGGPLCTIGSIILPHAFAVPIGEVGSVSIGPSLLTASGV